MTGLLIGWAALAAFLLWRQYLQLVFLHQKMDLVMRLLTGWAVMWGEPPEIVRPKLIEILRGGPDATIDGMGR